MMQDVFFMGVNKVPENIKTLSKFGMITAFELETSKIWPTTSTDKKFDDFSYLIERRTCLAPGFSKDIKNVLNKYADDAIETGATIPRVSTGQRLLISARNIWADESPKKTDRNFFGLSDSRAKTSCPKALFS
jgi:hypothetical protein